ncbi:MAG TPA: SMP-30/gluconolactonase/LRE family protein [Pseudomonadales bacterium]
MNKAAAPSITRTLRLLIGTLLMILSGMGFAQTTVDPDWAQLPAGTNWDGSTSWITADKQGNVIVLVRTPPYFRVFTRDGVPVRSFGEAGQFDTAHSIGVDPDGNYWVSDSTWHVVRKFSPDGELLMTLGQQGVAGDNTSTDKFNQPNHVAFAPNGDVYVSDGYVNARVVHFTKDGEFVRIIGGTQGSEPGQLQVPHGVAIDSQGRILVNDSDNARVSVVAPDGTFVESWPFPSRGGIEVLPDDTVYVSDVNAGIVNIVKDGELLDSVAVDRAHGLGVDTNGDIYVSGASRMTVYKVTRP